MSLIGKQPVEAYFFDSFLRNAINGESKYEDIFRPIILEACEFANKRISLMKLSRKYFRFIMYLSKIKCVKKCSAYDLKLSEIREYIISDWENYCTEVER